MTSVPELEATEDVPVIIVDQEGLIRWVNDCFVQRLGWARATLLGEPVTTIVPERFREAHQLGFSRIVSGGRSASLQRTVTWPCLHADGREIQTKHTISGAQRDEGWVFAATIEPTQ